MIYDELSHNISMEDPFQPRDVYWCCVTDELHRSQHRAYASVESGPYAALLRISTQFSAEYTERNQRIAVLCIKSVGLSTPNNAVNHSFLAALKYTQQVRLHVSRSVFYGPANLETHACKWLAHIQSRAQSPLEVQVTMLIPYIDRECYYPENLAEAIHNSRHYTDYNTWQWHEQGHDGRDNGRIERIVETQGVKRVEVRCTSDDLYESVYTQQQLRGSYTVYGSWVKGQGWKSGKVEGVGERS